VIRLGSNNDQLKLIGISSRTLKDQTTYFLRETLRAHSPVLLLVANSLATAVAPGPGLVSMSAHYQLLVKLICHR
jgi:hypothetical protein